MVMNVILFGGNREIPWHAQLVERMDNQTEGTWFESLQWRLIYLLHLEPM